MNNKVNILIDIYFDIFLRNYFFKTFPDLK